MEIKLSSTKRCAEFARGYFMHLDALGVACAVLHDWQGGFEYDLSDVDHVVANESFPHLTRIIANYCYEVGWQLCQVLRHETTAAYFVCSAQDDPSCVVALDACSDYRWNGSLLMSANDLLVDCQPLPWGGARLSVANELKYRMIKAAAKQKNAADIGVDLASYSAEAKQECEKWLESRWGVHHSDWSVEGLSMTFADLHRKTSKRSGYLRPDSLILVAKRIIRPSGLLVLFDSPISSEQIQDLRKVLGNHYFRRTAFTRRFVPSQLLTIIRSTVIFTENIGWLEWLCPSSCLLELESDTTDSTLQKVVVFLNHRCSRRENLNIHKSSYSDKKN